MWASASIYIHTEREREREREAMFLSRIDACPFASSSYK